MADVFISYSASDRLRIAPLVHALKAQGWSVWWDRDIPPGPRFDREIEKAIDSARCVLVCWSEQAVQSEWVRTEANEGLTRGILVPVLMDSVQPPLAFRYRQAADLSGWQGDQQAPSLAPVLKAVEELLAAPARAPDPIDARRHAAQGSQPVSQQRPQPRRGELFAVLAALTVSLLLGGFWLQGPGRKSEPDKPSVAVMAFTTVEGSNTGNVLGRGLAAEVIGYLSTIPGLEVASRTSSFYFEQQPSAVREIGQLLQVEYLLEGEVRANEAKTIASVRLVDARTGRIQSSAEITATGDRVSLLRVEVADMVTRALLDSEAIALSDANSGGPIAASAYEAYLRGLAWLRRPQTAAAAASAIEAFDEAVAVEPTFAAAFAGRCEANLGQYKKYLSPELFTAAKRDCDRALGLAADGHDGRVHLALAALYRSAGDLEASLRELSQGEAERPESAEVQRQYGLTLAAAGNMEGAGQRFRRAIAIEPSFWDAYVSLANFHYGNGRYDEAVAEYNKVLELVPDYAPALVGRGSAYFMRNTEGDEANALSDWRQAESLGDAVPASSLALTYSNRGLRYYYLQQFDEAVAMQRKALALVPDDHTFWGRLAESYRGLNNSREAAVAYREALNLAEQTLQYRPRDWETLGLGALYASFLGREALMQEYLDRALEVAEKNPTLHYFSSLAQQAVGNTDAAFASLQAALELGFAKQLIQNDFDLQRLRDANPSRFAELLGDS